MNEIAKREPLTALERIKMADEINKDDEYRSVYCISVYKGIPATEDELKECLSCLPLNFPSIKGEQIALISAILQKNKFTIERAKDAVLHVLENCRFRTPIASDFTRYDKVIKLYSYGDCVRMISKNGLTFEKDLKKYPVKLSNGDCLWYRVDEVEKFKLQRQ